MIRYKYIFVILLVQVFWMCNFVCLFLGLKRPSLVFHLFLKFLGFLYQKKALIFLIAHFTAAIMFHFEGMSEKLTADVNP